MGGEIFAGKPKTFSYKETEVERLKNSVKKSLI